MHTYQLVFPVAAIVTFVMIFLTGYLNTPSYGSKRNKAIWALQAAVGFMFVWLVIYAIAYVGLRALVAA